MSTPLSAEFRAAVEAAIDSGYRRNRYHGLPTRWTKQQRADYVADRAASISDQIAELAEPLHEDLITGWRKRNRDRECDEHTRRRLLDSALRTLAATLVEHEFYDGDAYEYESYWPRSG